MCGDTAMLAQATLRMAALNLRSTSALLNFLLGILGQETTKACLSIGLEPVGTTSLPVENPVFASGLCAVQPEGECSEGKLSPSGKPCSRLQNVSICMYVYLYMCMNEYVYIYIFMYLFIRIKMDMR